MKRRSKKSSRSREGKKIDPYSSWWLTELGFLDW
jgi:hypothetical protein